MSHEKLTDSDIHIDLAVPGVNSTDNVDVIDVVGNKSDTLAGTSLVALSKAIKNVVDANALLIVDIKNFVAMSEQTLSASYTDAGGEQTIVELTATTRRLLHGVWVDLVNMTQNGTLKIYYKIDGVNYREIEAYPFTVATDSDGVYIGLTMAVTNSFKVTYTEGGDEAAVRAIPYSIVWETRE